MAEIGWEGMKKSNPLPVTGYQRSMNVLFFWLLVTGYWLLSAPQAQACPTCNELLTRGKDAFAAMRFSQGIAWTILLLFTVPFSMIGTFTFVIWRASRNKSTEVRNDG